MKPVTQNQKHMNRMSNKTIALFLLLICISLIIIPVQAVAPPSISGLGNTTDCHTVTWSWTNPPLADFNGTSLWRNGVFEQELTNATTTIGWTTLTPGGSYSIGIYTFNLTGVRNASTVNQTVTLPACAQPVTCTTNGIVGALSLAGILLIGGGALLVIGPFSALGGTTGRGGKTGSTFNSGQSTVGIIAICIGAVILLISYAVLSPIFTIAGC
jgi:hypothetical protein